VLHVVSAMSRKIIYGRKKLPFQSTSVGFSGARKAKLLGLEGRGKSTSIPVDKG